MLLLGCNGNLLIAHPTLLPYFSRNVVSVDILILQKHMKTTFILG